MPKVFQVGLSENDAH